MSDVATDTMSFRVPNVRPLETLHNALSFKKLDVFLLAILEGGKAVGTAGAPIEHSKSIDAAAPSVTFSSELSESWTMEHVSDKPSLHTSDHAAVLVSLPVPPLPQPPSPS